MKGIVVDRKGRYAVVLTGDGSFVKINNKPHFVPGHEIEFEKPFVIERSLLARVSSVAAVFLFILGLSYGVYSYTLPYSYVDFDVNPSIELTANVYDIIIKTETFNSDGAKLLKAHKLNFKKLDTGISELVNSAVEMGYLKAQTENAVLLTVISKDERKKIKLEKYMENATEKALGESKVESAVISQQTSSQKHDAAKGLGISPGKLTLIEKAIEDEPELKLENLKDKSVKEIMKHIKTNRKTEKQDSEQNKQENKDVRQKDKEDKRKEKLTGKDENGKNAVDNASEDENGSQDSEDKHGKDITGTDKQQKSKD